MHQTINSNFGKPAALLAALFILPGAQAALTYENVNGTGVVYDSGTGLYWLQNGNYANQNFTFPAAQAWASSLNIPGVSGSWQIPSVADFQSLESQLQGTGSGYYGTVPFGAGPNDYVSNVQGWYWTSDSAGVGNQMAIDQYGYAYPKPVTDSYSVWVVATAVPEPGTVVAGALAVGVGCLMVLGRRRSAPQA